MRDVTLRGLRIFEAVAAAASVSRGAELMGMTQSAASQQIRTLEEEVGSRLFDTQARPIRLTDAGRELLRHTRVILAQLNVAADALSAVAGDFRGQIHIGAVSPANYFAPRLITAFRKHYPDVRIKLTVDKRDALLKMLAERQIDLMLAGYPPAEFEVEVDTFARHPHCLVASIDHPCATRRGLTWNDLRHEPFIFREAGSATRQFLEHLLQTQRLQVNVDLELAGNETVKQAVMAGMGISFLSAHVIQVELNAGKIAVLDVEGMPKWLDWCLLYRREPVVPVIRQAFKEFVRVEGAQLVACVMGPTTAV